MEWADWEPSYRAICAQFGYDPALDLAAARLLHPAVAAAGARWGALGVQLRNRRNVAVLGCGPGLVRTPPSALQGVVVACDGAATWLREQGVAPHVVVTDLDGPERDLRWAAGQGSLMVVHAHGDNRDAIARLAPALGPLLYGTYQCAPEPGLEPMRNLGGFTDGDRAVLLCEAMGTRAAALHGFEFGEPPSPYSHRWDPATKPAKLAWAQRLVQQAHGRGRMAVALYRP